ncbi:DUF4129 domain-containing protein [Aggregatilinea lenta]|uniref:DUF4129 domain-containing protein n=1 Tax=Aggregatilinea lenta TaxID=913108 RepID=UPI0013C3432C|nr:DUF4129 domain-containing protein [Aggregatilinea lenta]
MRLLPLFAAIVLLTMSLGTAQAQSGTVDEAEFWRRFQQTDSLLETALAQPRSARQSTLAEADRLWAGVTSVRLLDGTIIDVNVAWVRVSGATEGEIRQVQARVQAILAYESEHLTALADAVALQEQLNRVLRDQEAAQPDAEPAGASSSSGSRSSSSSSGSGGSWFAQMMLIALAVVIVGVVVASVLRTMQMQRVTIDLPPDDDAPVSAQEAVARAESATATQDYRTAIRYLYLSGLLALDERGIIRYDPSLTNQEHLAQLAGQPRLRALFEPVVTIFDRVWYGVQPADAALYEDFRRALEQVERQRP